MSPDLAGEGFPRQHAYGKETAGCLEGCSGSKSPTVRRNGPLPTGGPGVARRSRSPGPEAMPASRPPNDEHGGWVPLGGLLDRPQADGGRAAKLRSPRQHTWMGKDKHRAQGGRRCSHPGGRDHSHIRRASGVGRTGGTGRTATTVHCGAKRQESTCSLTGLPPVAIDPNRSPNLRARAQRSLSPCPHLSTRLGGTGVHSGDPTSLANSRVTAIGPRPEAGAGFWRNGRSVGPDRIQPVKLG